MNLEVQAKNIIENAFELKKEERLLILSELFEDINDVNDKDKVRWQELNKFTENLYVELKKLHKNTYLLEYPSTKGHGKEPDLKVWEFVFGEDFISYLNSHGLSEKLLTKSLTVEDKGLIGKFVFSRKANFDVIMAITNFSTSHTFFRKLFTEIAGGRYASMPLFDPEMFNTSMTADINELSDFTTNLADYLDNFVGFQILSDNGTNIYISKEDRNVIPDTGKLNKPGSFSNLPAGEAFFAPVEGKSHGTLILEYAPTRKLDSSIKITVENGIIKEISGNEPYVDEMLEKINRHPNNKFVAELGFGTNNKAIMLDNILESEKIYGTIHIAFGDNHAFGGKNQAPFHEDYLVLYPEVYGIDKSGNKTLILKDRSYMLKF
ncbi:peptidase [Deferribacter autotrophicus]|uniref:Peptidase n=1 Tax=Deferribacter autotrophicus TaxID=500465 RepID=A0A5A8F3L0_9BACT|nr:aminopeptidase [Deferribacter autotrophicus]KAA0257074.1 peptidase [Deferribacter autotrophicus]